MRRIFLLLMGIFFLSGISHAQDAEKCISCHQKITPKIVSDWKISRHAESDVSCIDCHGSKHKTMKDYSLARLPDELVCAECHQDQYDQFMKGKHSLGWKAMMALPVSHMEPVELIQESRGCGGCHTMGIKPKKDRQMLKKMGFRYEVNSCDECHTRHTFSKKEALDPQACQKCHMGFDHPQWEIWSSSKHGERYMARSRGNLSKRASAPTCQFCHLPNGTHTNRTAWGFFALRLPLPKDKQWKEDRITILKALGVLDPHTGKPTERLNVVKSLDMVRLTEEDFQKERERLIKRCTYCHSEQYVRKQLELGDRMIRKADHLMAEAIRIVAGLYRDGILKKPKHYKYAYPDFLYFYRTGGSHIDQLLFKMFMKDRMRIYEGIFHGNPDYAYWYGWAAMTKDLAEIKEIAKILRATHKKE